MDADDLARGRALLERSRDTTGSWQDWQIAGHHWQSWLATHAADLLDAAGRAARLEAALLEVRQMAHRGMTERIEGGLVAGMVEPIRDRCDAAIWEPKGAGGE